jgi:phosphoribosyl-ATP pyrophosphohydrolase
MVSGLKPLVVRSGATVVDVTQTNEKGFRKSIEHGKLWVVHPDTGRLLPYADDRGTMELHDRGSWYEVELASGGDEADGKAFERPRSQQRAAGKATDSSASVLPALYSLIAQRKHDLPEGSYTTYLFQQGTEKIKKKTGEEAIELLLADTHHDRVHEAADLIYHLLVLLVATGVSFEDLIQELESR